MDESKVVVQSLNKGWYDGKVAAIDMLRLDLIDSVVSGNKWYKLKYNLQYAQHNGHSTILTFGGAYSNHLIATAAAANEFGIKALGVVRGNDGGELNETLKQCAAYGMQLHFVSREDYARRNDTAWLRSIAAQFGDPFIIPEGGANEQGRLGAEEIARIIPSGYSHVAVSVGSGTTFIGLHNALPVSQNLLGFAPMKNGRYLENEIAQHLRADQDDNWQLFDRWHFGGFGKWNDDLLHFMNSFYEMNDIPLDIVYTSKMMFALDDMLKEHFFRPDASVLCIHSGGLQGNSSVAAKLVYNSRI
ncbi:MAG: pyridoxal-phosphate dependent enzyme [Bacteroidetes bacterium]|nr:pyridoxal-phosphate dependent enzyme [Bacteroidota bacterium]